jgi:hypothetical protein
MTGTYKDTYKDTGRYLGMQQDRNIFSTDIRAHISICKATYKGTYKDTYKDTCRDLGMQQDRNIYRHIYKGTYKHM